MNRVSSEFRNRRIESADNLSTLGLELDVLIADDAREGELRKEVLSLVAAARPDLHERGEVAPFLDEARDGEDFRLVTARKQGSGLLVATMWAERLNIAKHIPDDHEQFADRITQLDLNDSLPDAYYAPNGVVLPSHRRKRIGSTIVATALSNSDILPGDTAVFYRRAADRVGGQELERAFGVERVLQSTARSRDVPLYLNVAMTSPVEN